MIEQFLGANPLITLLLIVWVIPWKGVALWKAAKRSQKWWFIVLLIVNTLAVLEIFYIFVFSKRKNIVKKEDK